MTSIDSGFSGTMTAMVVESSSPEASSPATVEVSASDDERSMHHKFISSRIFSSGQGCGSVNDDGREKNCYPQSFDVHLKLG